MLEVNDFDAVHISLSSPEQIRSWSPPPSRLSSQRSHNTPPTTTLPDARMTMLAGK